MDKRNFRKVDDRERKIDIKDRGDLKDKLKRKLLVSDTKVTHPGGDTNKRLKTKPFNKIEDTTKNEEVRSEKEKSGANVAESKEAYKDEKRNKETKLKTISVVITENLNKEVTKVSETNNSDIYKSAHTARKPRREEKTDSENNSRGSVNKDKETKPSRKPFIKTITSKDPSKVFKAVTFIDQKKQIGTSLEVKIPNENIDNDKTLKIPENNEKIAKEKHPKVLDSNPKTDNYKSPKFFNSSQKTASEKYSQFLDSTAQIVRAKNHRFLENKRNISSDMNPIFRRNNEKITSNKYPKFRVESGGEIHRDINPNPGINEKAFNGGYPKYPDGYLKVPNDKNPKLLMSNRIIAYKKNGKLPYSNANIISDNSFPDTDDKSATPRKVTVEKKKKKERRKKTMKRPVTSPEITTRVKSPATEVAKWAPSSINHLTKPYYEAWVNTTLAAISKTSKKDKLFLEKQKLLENFKQILNERPESPDLTYENFADERYTGRIKVRQR